MILGWKCHMKLRRYNQFIFHHNRCLHLFKGNWYFLGDTSVLLWKQYMACLPVFFRRSVVFLISNQMLPVVIEYIVIMTVICVRSTRLPTLRSGIRMQSIISLRYANFARKTVVPIRRYPFIISCNTYYILNSNRYPTMPVRMALSWKATSLSEWIVPVSMPGQNHSISIWTARQELRPTTFLSMGRTGDFRLITGILWRKTISPGGRNVSISWATISTVSVSTIS